MCWEERQIDSSVLHISTRIVQGSRATPHDDLQTKKIQTEVVPYPVGAELCVFVPQTTVTGDVPVGPWTDRSGKESLNAQLSLCLTFAAPLQSPPGA